MKPALIRWLRHVAPPVWLIAGVVACCGLFEGLYFWLSWQWGWQAVQTEFFAVRDLVCVVTALVLGVRRVAAYHPQFDSDYLGWLWLTPWKADRPLPKGPLHLVLQDIVIVGMLVGLMAHNANVSLVAVPLSFLLGYYLMLMLSLFAVDLRWMAYVMSGLIGLIVRCVYESPGLALVVALVVYLYAWLCLRCTLATFPWTARASAWRKSFRQKGQGLTIGHREYAITAGSLDRPELELPWPFRTLHPRQYPAFLDRADRIAFALLTCWWAWVIFSVAPSDLPEPWRFARLLYVGLASSAIVMRLAMYVVPCLPPISLWGRIWTGRWIIPGYDMVFLTPLATLLMAVGVPTVLHQLHFPPVLVLTLSLLPFLLMAMLGPPRLGKWILTSPARLSAGARNQQQFEEI